MSRYRFYSSCVDWPRGDVPALSAMIDEAQRISRHTLLRHVGREELARVETGLGYAPHPRQGLTMAGDFHVGYHRSTLHGRRVYFFTWSAIEHVFTPREE